MNVRTTIIPYMNKMNKQWKWHMKCFMKMKNIILAPNVTQISEKSVKNFLVAISIWIDTLSMLFSGVCSFKWSWIIHLNPVLFSSFPDSVNWLILWWKDLLNWNWNHVSNIMTSKIEVPANCMVSMAVDITSMVSQSFAELAFCLTYVHKKRALATPNFINDIGWFTIKRRRN